MDQPPRIHRTPGHPGRRTGRRGAVHRQLPGGPARPARPDLGPRPAVRRLSALARRDQGTGRHGRSRRAGRDRIRPAQHARARVAKVSVHRSRAAHGTTPTPLARPAGGRVFPPRVGPPAACRRPFRGLLSVGRHNPREAKETLVTDSVRWDLDGAVATITLNRPEARNALTAEMKTTLLSALRRAEAAAEVRAVIITGAGPGFCAGQDLREHAEILAAGEAATDTVRLHYNPIIMTITTMPKPGIAGGNGGAAGAGASRRARPRRTRRSKRRSATRPGTGWPTPWRRRPNCRRRRAGPPITGRPRSPPAASPTPRARAGR